MLARWVQVRHHMRGLADGLPHLAYLLIVNGLLGGYSQTGSAVNQHSQTPAQRGQQLMDSLSSVELPSGPGSAQASLLCVTARQFHLSAAVQDALAQVCDGAMSSEQRHIPVSCLSFHMFDETLESSETF